MNDAQIWTMIGSLTALMFGMLTVVSTLFIRVVRAEIGGLRHEVLGEIGGLRHEVLGEIGGLRSEFRGELRAEIGALRGELRGEITGLRSEMNARFDTMDAKLKGLDTEVHALVKHTFGFDRD
ncbi:hypothetical protein [Microbacterium sp.]|uniref:hypothetical protein n=1 Tax=Microbacterium sp. TaxID=51671 RepID=UPI002FE3C96D